MSHEVDVRAEAKRHSSQGRISESDYNVMSMQAAIAKGKHEKASREIASLKKKMEEEGNVVLHFEEEISSLKAESAYEKKEGMDSNTLSGYFVCQCNSMSVSQGGIAKCE